MSRSSWAPFALFILVSACGGAPPPVKAPRAADKPAKATAPNTPRNRLIAVLHTVQPRGPVLGALDGQARADLDALVKQVSPAQRSTITRSGSPFATERPLLFLALDGDSPDAYYALATQGRGADELVGMRRRNGGADLGDLVQVAAEVSRRAAAQWLRDRAVDAASKRALTPELCDAIDRVASTMNRLDVQRRAREMAEKLDPSAIRQLGVARAAAWQLDVGAARSALAGARTQAVDSASAKAIEQLIDEASLVNKAKGQKLDVDAAVKAARALLDLQHPDRVAALLAPHRAQAGSHLGLASALALASTGTGMCAGIPDGAGNALLCATAWESNKDIASVVELLDSAWKSGKGRDDAAIQTWLGMEYVLPWVYGTIRSSSAGDPNAQAEFQKRLSATQHAVKDAASASHTFDGLVLFVDASAAGFEASAHKKPGERIRLDAAVQKDLEQRALALGKSSADQRFTQAAVLAVAGMLSQERDIGPLLALLPEPVAPVYRQVRAVLEASNGAAHGADSDAAKKGRRLLAELIPRTAPHSLPRAQTVLLMAELDATLTRKPRAYNVLGQVAGQLTGDQVPPALRLQAGIDRAGVLSRVGRSEDAQRLLSRLVASPATPGGGDDPDLALLARGYLLVLRARVANGAERQQYLDKLSHLFDGRKQVLPRVRLWRDMWQRELSYQAKADQCGALKACLARAKRERKVPEAEINAALGPVSAGVLRAGTLALGTLSVQFNFSRALGLEPQVQLEPRLLAVEIPPAP